MPETSHLDQAKTTTLNSSGGAGGEGEEVQGNIYILPYIPFGDEDGGHIWVVEEVNHINMFLCFF